MAILINKKGLSAVVHLTANATLTIAGAAGVSDIATGDEVLTGAYISQIWYGTGNGAYWEIKRGSNTAFHLDSTGYIDFTGNGVALNKDVAATLVANLNLSQTGSIIIELIKVPTSSTYA
jgi:hypothetical protein